MAVEAEFKTSLEALEITIDSLDDLSNTLHNAGEFNQASKASHVGDLARRLLTELTYAKDHGTFL